MILRFVQDKGVLWWTEGAVPHLQKQMRNTRHSRGTCFSLYDDIEGDTVFTLEAVRKFHGWTHTSFDILLDHLATIPANDYQKKMPGYSFDTLRNHMIHVLNCEGVWIQSLQGMPYVDRNADDCPAVADARLMKQEMKGRTEAYLSGLTDEGLNTDTELRFPDGALMIRTPALILHHVLTHAFHHKGLMVAMCRELGYPAPDTHLCQFQ